MTTQDTIFGFEALDYIADKEGISINTGKHKALIGTGYMGGEKVLLVKPQTFYELKRRKSSSDHGFLQIRARRFYYHS